MGFKDATYRVRGKSSRSRPLGDVVASFKLDWGEGASKSGNLCILPDRTDPTNKADRYSATGTCCICSRSTGRSSSRGRPLARIMAGGWVRGTTCGQGRNSQ